jgi:hypothetical protein
MISLYDSATALPVNKQGKSPMQPVCLRRLQAGHRRLIAAVKGHDLEAVRKALDEIGPLLACQFRNDGLPCAQACHRATDAVSAEFQGLALRGQRDEGLRPPRRAGH